MPLSRTAIATCPSIASAEMTIFPVSVSDQTWIPAIAETPSSAPSSIMAFAPGLSPCSSAGWKISRTLPGISASMSLRTIAAPSSMAVCASCPHACMTPSFFDLYGTSFSSCRGSASMSARSATHVAPFPGFRSAMTPHSVPPNPFLTIVYPSFSSIATTFFVVSTSFQDSSGFMWKCRRRSMISCSCAFARSLMRESMVHTPFVCSMSFSVCRKTS